jgi:ArsR family transcriptional regulator
VHGAASGYPARNHSTALRRVRRTPVVGGLRRLKRLGTSFRTFEVNWVVFCGGDERDLRSSDVWLAYCFDDCKYRWMSKSLLPLIEVSGCEVAPLAREPLSAEAAIELAGRLKALSDPMRLRLFSVVASHAGGEACVCDLSAGIELSQPTISHHLRVLRTKGLLDSERRGSWVYYRVVPEALQQLSHLLSASSVARSR